MKKYLPFLFFFGIANLMFAQVEVGISGIITEDENPITDWTVFYSYDGDAEVHSVLSDVGGIYNIEFLSDENLNEGCGSVFVIDCWGNVISQEFCWSETDFEFVLDFEICEADNQCFVVVDYSISPNEAILSAFAGPDTPNMTYSWTDETGLVLSSEPDLIVTEEGVYCVVAQDLLTGCAATECVDIIFEDQGGCISWIEQTEFVDQAGNLVDALNVLAFEGVAPYTYEWSTGETTEQILPTDESVYCATVTDNLGCTSESCYDYVSGNSDSLCFLVIFEQESQDGIIDLQAFATGIGEIEYIWSNGDTGSLITLFDEGTYCVTITDENECQQSQCYDFVFGDCSVTIGCDPTETGAELFAFSEGVAPITYQWSTGEITQGILVTETAEYCVTMTDGVGCEAVSCQFVDLTNIGGECVTFIQVEYLDDEQVELTALGEGAGSLTYIWDTGADTESIIVTEEGEYCVTTVDAAECESFNCVYVSIGEVDCASWITEVDNGDFSILTVQSTEEIASIIWSTGAMTQSIEVDEDGVYCALIATTEDCFANACYEYNANEGTSAQINGVISTNDQVLNDGFVYLIEYDADEGTLTAVDTVWAQGGFFNIEDVPYGQYLIKAALTPDAPDYDLFLPSYHHLALLWSDASFVDVNQPNIDVSIDMIEGDNPGGPGFIGGLVSEGANATGGTLVRDEGDPISGVSILLLDEFDNPVVYSETDGGGNFSFENIAFGTYKVYIDVLAKAPVFKLVTISDENPEYDNIEFEINTNNIVLTDVEDIPEINSFNVYPNPFTSFIDLEFELSQTAELSIKLYNSNGVLMSSYDHSNLNNGRKKIQTNEFVPGLYFIHIQHKNGSIIRRIVKY